MQHINQAQACYSDYAVVELAPVSDSLIIEVETEELPHDFFEGFFEEVEQISTLPNDFFDDFFDEVEQISTLPNDFFDDFFEEVDQISTLPNDFFGDFFEEVNQISTKVVQPTEKVRKRVSNPTPTPTQPLSLTSNETRAFLYDPYSNVYEEWRKK